MNLTELQAAWAVDCVIDEDNPGHSAAITPNLHSKYVNECIQAKLHLTKIQHELIKLQVARARYFRGEMTSDELKERNWPVWQYKSLKNDIGSMIEACEDVQVMVTREAYLKHVIYFCESCLSEIKARSFHTRALIDYLKWRSGG
jgi:hypothetical protein